MIRRNGKFLSVMLSVCMAAGSVPAVFAQDGAQAADPAGASAGGSVSAYSETAGTDIENHWAKEAMQEFIDAGYINGIGEGTYKPDGTMTRAQFAAILNRMLRYTEESADITKYSDITAAAWYRSDMAKALAAGYMSGTSSDTMSPETALTREQAFVMLARILKLDTSDTSSLSAFADADDISDWARGSAAALVKEGYVSGDDNRKINPKKLMTRAEGVTVLSRSRTALDEHKVITKGVYTDGVYTGTGAGYGGTMKVQVTIKDGKIADIQIVSQSETGSYLERAKTLLQKIIDNNGTTGVSAVSGATRSSNGIFDAVNACLSQAEGGKDTSTTGSTGGGHGGSGNAVKPSDDDEVGRWADGTYTGKAQGYSSAGVTAEVTVADGKITNIKLTNNGETSSYYSSATGKTKKGITIIEQIISEQSTNNIDTVSGATRSSYAIINAIKAALKQASDAVTGSYTFEVSNWAEFTEAADNAADGDIIKLTADITDAGEDYTKVEKDDQSGESGAHSHSDTDAHVAALSEEGASGSASGEDTGASAEKTYIDAVTSATYGMMTLSKKLTIDGQDHKITNSDDPEHLIFTFNISGNITMKDLTIDGAAYGNQMGGGICVAGTGASLDMSSVTVKNCVSYKTGMPGNGGAGVWVKNGTFTAENCVFENNKVNTQGCGGAVMVSNSASASLTNCEFKNNSAPYGGAVAAYGTSTLTVKDSKFSSNRSENGGNDIYIFDGATEGESGAYSDSKVSYTLTGNTYGTYAGGDAEYKNTAVMMGRYYTTITTTDRDSKKEITKDYIGSGADAVFAPGYDATFTDKERTAIDTEKTVGDVSKAYTYMLMNIPFADFYKAETGSNTVPVDAMTSATKAKTMTGSLAGGSYHVNSDGTDITGSIYPVLVKNTDIDRMKVLGGKEVTADSEVEITTTNRGKTNTVVYKGGDALFQQKSYSYYITSEAPAYYKMLTFDENGTAEFGAARGSVTKLEGITASFSTDSSYGDYQLDLIGITQFDHDDDKIYGTLIKTADGSAYGLRHVENIWLGTELAWCTGFTTAVHNCPTSSAHYESMMGKTINEVVYYTSKGTFSIPVDDIYVPVKFTHTFSAADSESGNSTAIAATGFDASYDRKYEVTDSHGVDVTAKYGFSVNEAGTELSWTSSPLAGTYTLTVSDGAGKYAPVKAQFVIKSGVQAAQYDADQKKLVKADGVSDEELANYLENISKVSVKAEDAEKATDYAASGRGSVKIINSETGAIDLTAQSNKKNIFEQGKMYEVTVTSTGCTKPLTFSVSTGRYITMNVPYTDFYKAYDLTDASVWEVEPGVDAVSTATTSKFKGTTGLARGTYNNGKYIMGVTLPVEVSAEDYAKLNSALGESDDYHFTDAASIPSASTKLTVNEDGSYSFSMMSAAADEYADQLSVSQDTLTLLDGYGDYQIDITGYKTQDMSENKDADLGTNIGGKAAVLYGVIMKTDRGKSYGMTCLENTWVGTKTENVQAAWSIKEGQGLHRGHGAGDEFYQFEDMNGAKLTGVTLITSAGLINVDADVQLPEYYTGDLSGLTYAISSDSDELSISGVPEELKDVTVTVSYKEGRGSAYLAQYAEVNEGKVKLSEAPEDGVSYTLTINSSNFPGISRTVSTTISDAQIAELERWIKKAEATTGYEANNDLLEHVGEAREMIAERTASSAEAATLTGELEEKVKKTYTTLTVSAELAGDKLTVTLPDGVDAESLENAQFTLIKGSGRGAQTIASGALDSLEITLDKAVEAGTTLTLTIICDNYKDSSCNVTATAAAAAAEQDEEEEAVKNAEQDTETAE